MTRMLGLACLAIAHFLSVVAGVPLHADDRQEFLNLRHLRLPLFMHGTATRRTRLDRSARAFQRRYVPCRVAVLLVRMATFFPLCRRYCGHHQWHRTKPFPLNRLA